MDPRSLFESGKLREAITALGAELKKFPLDMQRRTFLFELLCFAGEYERAEKQLDLLAGGSSQSAQGVLLYQTALHAERLRQEMFQNGKIPGQDQSSSAASGSLNGHPFNDLTDSDPRIGRHLEAFIAGSYTWIPFRHVEAIEIQRPSSLRDLLWIPARIRTTPAFRLQDLGEVLLPVLYPNSATHNDESVALGRITVWEQDESFGEIPFGRKMFVSDSSEVPILEIQRLSWTHSSEESELAPA